MLVKYAADKKDAWADFLDTCVFAYNTSQQESTLHSPFEVMFGRKAAIPIDIDMLKSEPDSRLQQYLQSNQLSPATLDMLTDQRKQIIEQTKMNIKHAQEKQKQQYDRRRANPSLYTIGAKVLKKDFLRRKRAGGKGDCRFIGPYRIMKSYGRGVYGLELIANPSHIVRVNGAHLKPYYTPPSSPTPSLCHNPQPQQSPDHSRNLDISVYCSWQDGGSANASDHSVDHVVSLDETASTMEVPFQQDNLMSPPAASTPKKQESVAEEKNCIIYKTNEQVTVSVRSVPLTCRIVQVCGRPGLPLYRLQCRYGILKRVYRGTELMSSSQQQPEEFKSDKPVTLSEVVRLYNADFPRTVPVKLQRQDNTETVDLTAQSPPAKRHRQESKVLHVQGTDISLTEDNLNIIVDGKWLTDKHIDAAQGLLKKQFPHVRGLQSPTLSQTQTFEIQTGEFAQILNTGGHWVTVTRTDGQSDDIEVYDSLYSVLPMSTKECIAGIAAIQRCATTKQWK